MGAPIGNQNAKEGRIWRDALRRAVLAEDGARLRRIADALVAKAEEGDVPAIKELGDRNDGKVAQPVGIGQDPDAEPVQVQRVERVIVRGNAAD